MFESLREGPLNYVYAQIFANYLKSVSNILFADASDSGNEININSNNK